MIARREQRRVERLNVPRHCRGAGRGAQVVYLVDLSPTGARIEHGEPLPDWTSFPIDLPPALGGGRIWAEVKWSRVSGRRQDGAGKGRLAFESGLAFTQSTSAEQAAVISALVRIAGEWALGMLRDLRRLGEGDPTHPERFDALCGETLAWLRREIEALRFAKSQ